jgi:hypothetical protein
VPTPTVVHLNPDRANLRPMALTILIFRLRDFLRQLEPADKAWTLEQLGELVLEEAGRRS